MKTKWLATALFLFVLSWMALPALAQEALEPDTPVTGEITDDAYAVEYTYEGSEGEVVVISLIPVDVLADLDNPAIVLLDSSGTELVRYDGFGSTAIVWQLPADDTYTIVATRSDDAEGTSVGEYTLMLSAPQVLAVGDSVEAEITSEDTQYYVIDASEAFLFSFQREGEYDPEFTVNTIDTEITPGTLDSVLVIGGKYAQVAAVGPVEPGMYVVKVGQSLFSFYFDAVAASYTLSVSAPQ